MFLGAVTKVFEDIGSDVIANFLNVSTVSRVLKAIDTSGGSELGRLESQLLSKLRPGPLPFQGALRKVEQDLLRAFGGDQKSGHHRRPGKRTAKLHAQWLEDNRWRFDWRSQPRRPAGTEAGGEWMEGRLDQPVVVKYALSRRERQRRTRLIKAYKARQGKAKTRTIHTAWGDY